MAGACLMTVSAIAGTVAWSGGNTNTDLNWSDGLNWAGSAPGNADDVKFFDAGTVSVVSNINSIVDGSFGGTISSIQFGNTNNFHTVAIPNGTTLTVNGTLTVETPTDPAVARNLTNTVTGTGGTLVLNNSAAVVCLNQGTASLNGSRANLDLSGLGNFIANVSCIGLGTINYTNPAQQRNAGQLILARTNTLTLNYSDTLANYQTSGKKNALELADAGAGNNASIFSMVLLGITNAINVDSIGCGRDKASASSAGLIVFNPGVTNNSPSAYFRGVSGGSSRIKWWGIGDMNANASSAQVSVGTNDFTGGTVDAMVDVMSLARDTASSHTASATITGVLTYNSGTVNANTLYVGNQSLGPSTSTTPLKGIVNVNGSAATLVINTNLVLARTNTTSSAAANTAGILNVIGGTVQAYNIARGAVGSTIALGTATLTLTNTCGSPALPITTFNITNSTLNLFVTASAPTNICATTINTGGTTNVINLLSVAVFPSYPRQFPLISYAAALNGAGYDFGITNPLPASAPSGYLSNNVANKTIDLVLPYDPRPIITANPNSYSGSPGDNVSFSVSIDPNSVAPLGYAWYYISGGVTNLLADGTGPSGFSTIAGSSTATMSVTNAQPGDDGNYFVVVTNAFGTNTSAQAVLTISAGCVSPGITGPNNQTVIQGNNATFTANVTGNPIPAIRWQRNGVDVAGATTSSLVVTNVQYPADDGAIFSLIATNDCGNVTNYATLSVIVSPTITSQPVNAIVTNSQSASFTVAASGVPAVAYQWKKNGTPITGATSSTYTIPSAAPTDMGNYSCTITNLAGSTNSASVALLVNSTMSATALTPNSGATGVCYDTPLYITFATAPTLRTNGTIKIYNVANPATAVDTLDMSLNQIANPNYQVPIQPRLIGGGAFSNMPVIITGNTAAIYPHLGVMTNNQTYYVTIDDGVFADSTGAYFVGIATNAWQFSTKATGPANPTNIVVAADGSGDFVTLQGAVDSVPANNTNLTLINLRDATYKEIIYINSKNNLKIRGQSRNGTVIGYPNSNNMNGNGAPWRACFVLNGNDCSLENLTLTNMTPIGGSQAEALDVEGTRAVLYNMELDSYQDTFLVHSANKLVYFENCLIQGQTDFNWGYGTVYYTNCEIRCLLSGAHVTQPRSPAGTNGFGFINCRVTKGYTGSTASDLGRTINTPTSPSEVLFANCLMDDIITGYSSDAGPYMSDYSCSNLTATAVKTLANSTHLTSSDPYVIAIQTPATWFYGWQPMLLPNILTQPANQTAYVSNSVSFTVAATGVSAPNYQWYKGASPITGATNATLTINNVQFSDAGSYSVVISNAAGSVTSSSVTLTVPDRNPVATTATYTRPSGQPLNILISGLAAANWSDPDGDIVSLTGGISSTNAANVAYDGSFIHYTNANDVADQISYTVTDGQGGNGSGLINVIVGPPATNAVTSIVANGNGTITFNFLGAPNYQYQVEATTDLTPPINWVPVSTNTPGGGGTWQFTDSATNYPFRFYRTVYYP